MRLGTYIKFIPYPVTVGFTAGIAVIIFASQLRDLFGITLAGKEPGEFVAEARRRSREACPRPIASAIALAVVSVVIIVGVAHSCGRTGRAS